MSNPSPGIGTLRERPLHAALKAWYARPGDRVEVPVDGYVIDLVRDDLLIEVQTRGFSSMRAKVARLLDAGHGLRILHPVALDRWIVKVDDEGTETDRRLSPKHGVIADVFAELVSIRGLLADPALSIDVVVTREEEERRHEPGMAWRRRGWVVAERRLLEVVESRRLATVGDLAALVPAELPEVFTTADLARGLGRPRRLAQQMAYCLREVGVLVPEGKDGNAVTYRLAEAPPPSP